MNDTTTSKRIHPLMAGAAISVTVLGLVGAAAIAGLLPNSHSAATPADAVPAASLTAPAPALAQTAPQIAAPAPVAANATPSPAPAPVRHKPPRAYHNSQVAQASPQHRDSAYRPADDRQYQQPVQQPQPQAAAQPNYVGIGAGAVIGGLLGNQVGGGRGKTLATIAGAVGGGMLGNEVQKQVRQPAQPQR